MRRGRHEEWSQKEIYWLDTLIVQGDVRKADSAFFPDRSLESFRRQVVRRRRALGVSAGRVGRPCKEKMNAAG